MQETVSVKPDWAWLRGNKTAFLAFGFGAGLAKKAPGTWGSLVGLLLSGLLLGCGVSKTGLFLLALLGFWAGVKICAAAGRALGVHDHAGIVWDEIIGMMLVCACVPQGFFWWLAAFAAFRAFDIAKPYPVSWADKKLAGGLGVMADDALAAAYAVSVLQILNGLL